MGAMGSPWRRACKYLQNHQENIKQNKILTEEIKKKREKRGKLSTEGTLKN